MTLLCVARCRSADHGGPREAAPAYRVCWPCHDAMRRHYDDMIQLAPDLEAALSNSMTAGGEKVSGSPAHMFELNDHAAKVRWQIHHDMVTTVRLVIVERGYSSYPVNEIEPMARWLSAQVDWLCAHDSAAARTAEAASWPGMARGAIHPNPSKRVKIGPCPRPDCPGLLTAVIRPQDQLLPTAIVCSWWTELTRHEANPYAYHVAEKLEPGQCRLCEITADDMEPHTWSADQWHALGRQMARAEAAA